MFVGSHTLEAVLEQARKQGELEPFFHVPVLLLVDAETDEQIEPVTAIRKPPVDHVPSHSGVTSPVVSNPAQFGNAKKTVFRAPPPCSPPPPPPPGGGPPPPPAGAAGGKGNKDSHVPSASGVTSHVVAIAPKFGNATKLSFGRSDVCDVVMPFAAVSKHHGYFEKIDGGWTVHDVGSTNNTVVNGKFARDHALLLSDGATVMFGPLMARFLMGPSFITVLKQRLAMKL